MAGLLQMPEGTETRKSAAQYDDLPFLGFAKFHIRWPFIEGFVLG